MGFIIVFYFLSTDILDLGHGAEAVRGKGEGKSIGTRREAGMKEETEREIDTGTEKETENIPEEMRTEGMKDQEVKDEGMKSILTNICFG